MSAPTRPLLRYLGGKWRLAPWIVGQFPPHRIYVEPYGGAASVLLRKDRAKNEILNDLDGEVVNLFRVLRSEALSARLISLVDLTPYSRAEYLAACKPTKDPVERARRTLIRSHFGYGTSGTRMDRVAGFRTDGKTATTNVASEWGLVGEPLRAVVDRLRGVTVESVPALDLIDRYDDPKTLFYLDPPYIPATRSAKAKKGEGYHTYSVEMSVADHEALLNRVARAAAMVVISGYPSPLYDAALSGWLRLQKAARAHMNSPRTEVLWINPAARAATSHQVSIFEAQA